VKITGIMYVQDMKFDNLSKGYMYVTGIEKLKERSSFQYTDQEEEIFKTLSKDPKICEKIYKSIAPGIYGNEEVKKAIACMLFGGSRKHLPDQTLLRGDINILLIGDPSTAKSQFLKFVEQTASIAVYTSGKGSSAAGLTASINKDHNTGEFQIEGGALVLADGGIVCIDEFDKMKPGDRVAIHEAMEQQTISVAKAGITTRLNSRCSILAAANPIFGRYDEFKQISEQIELQTTILSRFDCIFVVRDINTPENNMRMADHILDLHQGRTQRHESGELPFELMKKYVKYARAKVTPRLSITACERLQNMYVADRKKALEYRTLTNCKSSIPITVRQLEAIIRLSESLARMKLKQEVSSDEVDEAHYLFELSTLKSIEGKEFGYAIGEELGGEIQKIEEAIKKRVCVGSQVQTGKLISEMTERHGENGVIRAISNMVRNGEFR
jgi:DNA replication licensing factor MCM5